MSDLLLTATGRNALLEAQREALRQRMARFFGRNVAIDIEQYRVGGEFDLGTMLGALNVNNDAEILDIFTLLGSIGGLDVSLADTSIYVNATTGSDVTGTGSAARPYASLWFIPHLPRKIDHSYRILISTDVVMTEGLCITNEFGPNGCLSFVGVGPEVEILAGLAGNVVAVTAMNDCWFETQPSIAPTTATCRGFFQLTSGAGAGQAAAVCRADQAATRLWFRVGPITGIAPADTFRYIRPARKITTPAIDIDTRGSRFCSTGAVFGPGTRVNFINLELSIALSTPAINQINFHGLPIGLWFCNILMSDSLAFPIHFGADINGYAPLDAGILAASQLTINNTWSGTMLNTRSCGVHVIPPTADQYGASPDFIITVEKNCNITSVDAMGKWNFYGANVTLEDCSAQKFDLNRCQMYAHYNAIDPNAVGGFDGITARESSLHLEKILFGKARACVRMFNSSCRITDVGGDSTALLSSYSYSAQMNANSALYLSNAWIGTLPTTSDLFFTDPLVDLNVAFPAVNTLVTDALNNNCTRGDT